MPEDFDGSEGPDNLDEPPSFFPYEGGDRREGAPSGELVEVQVEGIFHAEAQNDVRRFVMLTDGVRKLPILIGPCEATAIVFPLQGDRPDRPFTHDLLKTIIERLGGRLERIVIDDLWNTTYYAKLYLKVGKDVHEIDARPSDSIALAIRFDAPIFVLDEILDQASEA